ncbi:MAG: NAD-dependent epimerase/dehydratase family protein [Deltaproteobacteria bacterium]|nr:NAD-dependent epimerase/dehydratase family protein [Deltaproteobacteria bacterium]
MSEQKRILVTGGAGFIGSHVADAFLGAGFEVAVVDNLSTGRQENVPVGAQFYPLDIKSRETFDLICRWQPHVLVHHAAQMSVRVSVADPVMDAQENILGSLNLFEAAVRAGVERIIFASTGGAMYGDDAPIPAREQDWARPECPYGIAKLAVEHYMHFYQREHGIIPLSLRYANVYGPRQNGLGEAGVVAIFIEKFLDGEQPIINGDGLQTRDFVYVGDVVAANLKALDYSQAGTFNIGTGKETDILTIYLGLQEIIGSSLGPVHGPAKPGEQRRSALESSLARERLGWQPQVSLRDGLTLTVRAFQERVM